MGELIDSISINYTDLDEDNCVPPRNSIGVSYVTKTTTGSDDGFIISLNYAGYIRQIYLEIDPKALIYTRQRNPSNVWTDWTQIATK